MSTTTAGGGSYTETMVVTIGGTPTTTTPSGTYSFSMSETSNADSASFSQSGTDGPYALLVYFTDVSNADASTPGNMNFSPVGRPFQDPVWLIPVAIVVGAVAITAVAVAIDNGVPEAIGEANPNLAGPSNDGWGRFAHRVEDRTITNIIRGNPSASFGWRGQRNRRVEGP